MFPFSIMWFIYNLDRRECIFLDAQYNKHVYDTQCMCGAYKCKNNPLTWNSGFLCEKANFCPCWSYAQSKLPIFSPLARPSLSPFSPFLSTHPNITTTNDINMPESSSIRHKKPMFFNFTIEERKSVQTITFFTISDKKKLMQAMQVFD